MREKDYVVIIGSANIDVAGYSHESLNYADSNPGSDSNLLIVFYVQIMPDDLVMQLHRF